MEKKTTMIIFWSNFGTHGNASSYDLHGIIYVRIWVSENPYSLIFYAVLEKIIRLYSEKGSRNKMMVLSVKLLLIILRNPQERTPFFHKVICCKSSSLVLVEEFPNEMCKRIYGDSKAAFISKYIRTATFSLSYYF